MDFLGCSRVKVDEKGRITIPVKFRKKLENKSLILSKVRVFEKPVIAVFPTYECAEEVLNSYINPSDPNYDRNLSISILECNIDSNNRLNIGKLLEDREEKEMIAVGRRKNFEIWYRSDLADYCESENLQFYL